MENANSHIKEIQEKILSDDHYSLKKVSFDYKMSDGKWVRQHREVYNRGDGACILLYHKKKNTVVLVKQFRMPTYMNANGDGFLIEICGGLLDNDNPEACIIRETREEIGYDIKTIKKVYEAFSSPGVLTEKQHFFIAEYEDHMKQFVGGGLDSEQEDIEVLELPFSEVIEMLNQGEIKDTRTIVLLQYLQIHKVLD
ncbi:GDP-mannose pyrophosphatase NudK [Psychroserpens sp. SPM9]|uniref:GDP-mannose pyrophosphatase NudK n=1 Tax=Psychroserpens sp. SPM9 TaxID=2975598 RepID=UPI0021A53865|nr:GDP-mannose pyrophosphatase NudK [Psychroserpens sp. SPM9]MDG5491868.1 GDP-mannose pyrophosphatase NudK [Psychroserpens sp. SPM9]